ncbi:membrane protein required for colicin V production [Oceanospirillum multiglobuliferum]|uniref:Colicin V production CvpA n=1 Tax=Oceanospirillum multiglobuliferum TaxID=64969 RepID=A0A1T4LKK2_9GAMM|nr:CvpA family protein [Oceanospirillum multiglobuliferum]OPX56622.1 hypothetical protein BTE48_01600 [Oceanospirillum multiglobuliferum]SJZ55270.1 membrane protein required for colicin V production [Oceanospirillum multiglobuliferum]
MIWLDWVIIAVLAVSALMGLLRGMVREAISLTTWVAAMLLGRTFGPKIADMLSPYLSNEMLRLGLGYALTVVMVIVIGSVAGRIGKTLVSASGLGHFDRALGLIFGTLRGAAILVIIVAIVSLTPLAKESVWHESKLVPMLEDLRDQAAGLIDQQIS